MFPHLKITTVFFIALTYFLFYDYYLKMVFSTLVFALFAPLLASASVVPRQFNNDPDLGTTLALRAAGTDVHLCAGVQGYPEVGSELSLYVPSTALSIRNTYPQNA